MKVEVELAELIGMQESNTLGLKSGLKVVIRTVTYHYCGIVESVADGAVVLGSACWLADSGRWSEFVKTGNASEVEMYPGRVRVSLGVIVDWCEMAVIPSETC